MLITEPFEPCVYHELSLPVFLQPGNGGVSGAHMRGF